MQPSRKGGGCSPVLSRPTRVVTVQRLGFSDLGPAIQNPSALHVNYEDMVKMEEVNEATILHNLKLRFRVGDIYTKVGPILVSINPFQWEIGEEFFNEDWVRTFRDAQDADEVKCVVFGFPLFAGSEQSFPRVFDRVPPPGPRICSRFHRLHTVGCNLSCAARQSSSVGSLGLGKQKQRRNVCSFCRPLLAPRYRLVWTLANACWLPIRCWKRLGTPKLCATTTRPGLASGWRHSSTTRVNWPAPALCPTSLKRLVSLMCVPTSGASTCFTRFVRALMTGCGRSLAWGLPLGTSTCHPPNASSSRL